MRLNQSFFRYIDRSRSVLAASFAQRYWLAVPLRRRCTLTAASTPTFHWLQAPIYLNRSASDIHWRLETSTRYRHGKSDRREKWPHNHIELKNCKSATDVVQLANQHIDKLSPNQTAACWSFISRLLPKQHHEEHLSQNDLQHQISILLKHTIGIINEAKPKELITIILSLSKAVKTIRSKRSKRGTNEQKSFRAVLLDENQCNVIFNTLVNTAYGKLSQLDPRSLSNLAYASATMKYDPVIEDGYSLLDGIASKSVECIKQFKAQDISNMVWAYATLQKSSVELFESIGNEIEFMRGLDDFKPQALSNTVWSFATLEIRHPRLFDKVGDTISDREDLQEFKPQELSNLVWAYASSGTRHQGLFQKVGDAVVMMNDFRHFAPQAYSNMTWAYATSNQHHSSLFKKLGDEIAKMRDLKSFSAQAISNIVWAYSTSSTQHRAVFQKIGDHIIATHDNNLKLFKAQCIANVLWAYAYSNHVRVDLFRKIGEAIIQRNCWKSYKSQDIAMIAWAYTVSNVDIPMFNDDFRIALVERSNELKIEDMLQLYQWHLWQTGENTYDGLPDSLVDMCREAFMATTTKSSGLQTNVVIELKAMGLNVTEEYQTESGYRIDALVEVDGIRVGVEVDGPFHFIGDSVDGSTMLKHRQVGAIDKIHLISAPYYEWEKLKDQGAKRQYLQSLLASVLPEQSDINHVE